MINTKNLVLLFFLFYSFTTFSDTKQSITMHSLMAVDSLLRHDDFEEVYLRLDAIKSRISKEKKEEYILYHALWGEYYMLNNKLQEAEKNYRLIFDIPFEGLSKNIALFQAKAINDLGIVYYRLGDFKQAKKAHFLSLAMYHPVDSAQGGSYNYGNLSILYKEQKKIDSALYFLDEAEKHAALAFDTMGVGFHTLNHGILLIDNSKPVEALGKFTTAFEIFKERGNQELKYYALKLMAGSYRAIYEYDKAIDLLHEARDYYKKQKNDLRLGQVHISIGEIYTNNNQLDSGQYYLLKGIETLESSHYAKTLLSGYLTLSYYYEQKQNFERARFYLDKIIKKSNGSYIGLESNAYLADANIFLIEKKYNKAIMLANKGLHLSNGSLSLRSKKKYYHIMYTAYKQLHQYSQALYYYEELDKINQESFNKEKMMEVARLEYITQLEMERERLELEKKNEVQVYQSQLEKEKMIIQVLMVVGGLLLIIFLILYRSYLSKRKTNLLLLQKNNEINELRISEKEWAEEAIALKERELTTVTMMSHQRNSILEELDQQIGGLFGKLDEESTKLLKDINKTIKLNITHESWEQFTYQFEKVHPKFFIQLKEKFPELTQRDHKICAYLKVGMERKEIAIVSNMTIEAVKKSLYRIKKKINLSAEDNLRAFILDL